MRKNRKSRAHPARPLSGPAPERASRPPKVVRSSVEDPLLDWPDDERQSDRWLLERIAEDLQRE